MIDDLKQFVLKEELFLPSGIILLAVSGGLDSVVMAHLIHEAGYRCGMAHANFQLRGDESEKDETFVRALAAKYQVPIHVKRFETRSFARKNHVSVQMAARTLRYDWFEELMKEENYTCVATAHHLDDQVETFLINMTRGTGIAGLHGILPKQGHVVRPLLFAFRAQIEAFALENKLEFVEDSSNRSDKFIRNRIRHKVIPQLELINPAFRYELTQTIGHIRDAEIIYRQTVEQKRKDILHRKGDEFIISADQFFSLKPLTSWAFELLSPFGFNLANIKDLTGMSEAIPGKEVQSATHRVIKDRDRLIVAPRGKTGLEATFIITINDLAHKAVNTPVNLGFEILHEIPAEYADPAITAYIDFDRLDFPLLIRKWRRGDYFCPMGMSKRKKLSDFFTDQKFSLIEKEKQWLICSGNNIVWIIGHRIDNRYKITSASGRILKITLYTD